MVATIDFSGLTSSSCALASAAARAPIELLDCCIAILRFEEIEADRAGLRSFRSDPMAARLLRILRHQALELGLCLLVLEMRLAGEDEDVGELGPGIGGAHIDNAD